MQGTVVSVNIAAEKGMGKPPVRQAVAIAGCGLEGDAHAGGMRQISILAQEWVDECADRGLQLQPGDFGENLTVRSLDPEALLLGQRLLVGSDVVLQVSDIGKECHTPCSIGQRLGECIMPTRGVFAKVIRGGLISAGDPVSPTQAHFAAVLTSSDRCSRGERPDESGPALIDLLNELGTAVADYTVLPDDEPGLRDKLQFLADRCAVDLILTTGGTGLAARDRMPEATLSVLTSPVPGVSEALRIEGMRHTPYACLSRGMSGLRHRTLIINLPGSKRAVQQSCDLLRAILPHALDTLRAESLDCAALEHRPLHTR